MSITNHVLRSARGFAWVSVAALLCAAGLAFAQSTTVHSDAAAPLQADVQDTPAGESVTLNADLAIPVDVTLNGTGGAQANFVCNVNGGGTGDTSAAAYQLAGGDSGSLSTAGPLPADVAFACRLHLMGQTPQTDQVVVAHLLATIDGSGSIAIVLRDVTTP